MDKEFDKKSAKEFLSQKNQKEKKHNEKVRQDLLKKIISVLKDELSGKDVEVFLVGSIIQPYKFTNRSDIDIVLKNFKGDRFDIWTRIESQIKRNIEVILYEKCNFKEYVEKEGLRVL